MHRPALTAGLLLPLALACTRGSAEPTLPRIDVDVRLHPYAYDAMLRLMPQLSLVRAINLDGGPPGEVLATLVELGELSRGRILVFTSVDWRDVDAADFGTRAARQLERAVALGARGLVVDKALGLGVATRDGKLLAVDDPRLDPLWAKAAELQVPVFLHTADPAPYFEPVDRHNKRRAEIQRIPALAMGDARFPRRQDLLAQRDMVLSRHPRTTFVCMGLASSPDDVAGVDALLDAFPNAMVDTATALSDLAGQPVDRVRAFFRKHRQRILFGSGLDVDERGWTLGSPAQRAIEPEEARAYYTRHFRFFETLDPEVPNPIPLHGPAVLQGLGLGADVLEAIYLRNAERVLGIGATPRSGTQPGQAGPT
ncbi:MAG: amidohydrolase family protein [Pseudomonadota bacterium]